MRTLEGKVALVTGASRGIGAETARLFAAEGASVAVTARTIEPGQSRFAGTINETVADIVDAGGTAQAFASDLADEADRSSLIDDVEAALGPVDVLVNNAAVTWFTPVIDFQPKHYDLMFEVQVKAPFQLSQRVLPGMLERGSGSILNISSKGGLHPPGPPFQGFEGGAVYGMVKVALERFTTALANEVYGKGISVNALSPTSVVETPGVVHHKLITPDREAFVEPVETMAEAALALVTGDPRELTGRIAYSQQLLHELGQGPEPRPEFLVGEHPRSAPRAAR